MSTVAIIGHCVSAHQDPEPIRRLSRRRTCSARTELDIKSWFNDRRGPLVSTATDQRLALALEAAHLGTWTWSMALETTTWDTRLEEMHGVAPGGFGGRFEDWVALLHPDDRAQCLAKVDE